MKTRKVPAAASGSTGRDRKNMLASSGRLDPEPSMREHIPCARAVAWLKNQVGDLIPWGSRS